MKIGKNAKRNQKGLRLDPRIARAAGTTIVALGTMVSGLFVLPSAYAEPTIFSDGSDAAGQDSFDGEPAVRFIGLAELIPVAGNDYVVDSNEQIRTLFNGGSADIRRRCPHAGRLHWDWRNNIQRRRSGHDYYRQSDAEFRRDSVRW